MCKHLGDDRRQSRLRPSEQILLRPFAVLRVVHRRGLKLGWGLIDQAASSATKLLLMIIAARILGAQALGVLVIGFTAYLVLLGIQRALVSAPLVISTAAAPAEERDKGSRCALTITLLGGTVLAALHGHRSHRRRKQRAAACCSPPWMLFALLQDLWRSIFSGTRAAQPRPRTTPCGWRSWCRLLPLRGR